MKLDRPKLQADTNALYAREHEALGERGTLERLERARQWDFAPTLRAGGVLVFAHAGVFDCGHQTAAAVHAALDSGCERVIALSVLHATTDEMQDARQSVSAGEDPSRWPHLWCVSGTGLDARAQDWRRDHALTSWRHFWKAETKRRGGRAPEMIERYAFLAGGRPDRLPGIDEFAREADGAALVCTIDAFHHGIGYGDPPGVALEPEAGGLAAARAAIEEGMSLLARGDYAAYDAHCLVAKSDGRDAGQTFRFLRGPMTGRIVDLTYTDTADLYSQPRPTWVAAALMEWRSTS